MVKVITLVIICVKFSNLQTPTLLCTHFFSILLLSINPSHQVQSALTAAISFAEVSIDCHFSLSRVWNYYSGDPSQIGWSLRRFASYCPWLVLSMRASTRTYACHSRTLAASLFKPTVPMWLEDNHARLLTYLLYRTVGFVSC